MWWVKTKNATFLKWNQRKQFYLELGLIMCQLSMSILITFAACNYMLNVSVIKSFRLGKASMQGIFKQPI